MTMVKISVDTAKMALQAMRTATIRGDMAIQWAKASIDLNNAIAAAVEGTNITPASPIMDDSRGD